MPKVDECAIRKLYRRDTHGQVKSGPPLDFSFQELTSLDTISLQVFPPQVIRLGRAPRITLDTDKYLTRSLWLNNNYLKNLNHLDQLVNRWLEEPIELAWLDVSFNCLTVIDPNILKYPKLQTLYLQANMIKNLQSLEPLRKLTRLRRLTLQGNPIASQPNYRSYVIRLLPQLTSLDFAGISPYERNLVPNILVNKMIQATRGHAGAKPEQDQIRKSSD